MQIRAIREADYFPITSVVDDWWGGRPMRGLLPRLFFQHFQTTSFAAEDEGEIVGFLIGFVSQTDPAEAYIHFIGVHPAYRKQQVARRLYELFFARVSECGCRTVRCITSPVNKTSIAFHTRMGFEIEPGAEEVDGIPVSPNYDGGGQPRVLFRLSLDNGKL
ncbi:GNAT family N-acetyltransferase [Paenibacillus sp. GCM10027626]|uniref:GNAT family N-acetyltransferase n=1 Tax=Paenibacillus sp. GCM10027626 TaxID=3273411 RepID=UPI00362E7929